MTRRPLRLWTGALLVAAALLLPQATMAQGIHFTLPVEARGGLSALWDFFVRIFQRDEADNRGTIDPEGLPATDTPEGDNRGTIDPNG